MLKSALPACFFGVLSKHQCSHRKANSDHKTASDAATVLQIALRFNAGLQTLATHIVTSSRGLIATCIGSAGTLFRSSLLWLDRAVSAKSGAKSQVEARCSRRYSGKKKDVSSPNKRATDMQSADWNDQEEDTRLEPAITNIYVEAGTFTTSVRTYHVTLYSSKIPNERSASSSLSLLHIMLCVTRCIPSISLWCLPTSAIITRDCIVLRAHCPFPSYLSSQI